MSQKESKKLNYDQIHHLHHKNLNEEQKDLKRSLDLLRNESVKIDDLSELYERVEKIEQMILKNMINRGDNND